MVRIFGCFLLIGYLIVASIARAQEPLPMDAGETHLQQLELSPQQARGAFDAYYELQEKFSDSAFEEYESLSDFVKRSPEGPQFDAIIQAHGFSGVDEWLPVINALEFTIGAYSNDQGQSVEAQIKELNNDTSLSEADRESVIEMLKASQPSANNRKVLEDMLADPAYAERIKSFISEE